MESKCCRHASSSTSWPGPDPVPGVALPIGSVLAIPEAILGPQSPSGPLIDRFSDAYVIAVSECELHPKVEIYLLAVARLLHLAAARLVEPENR